MNKITTNGYILGTVVLLIEGVIKLLVSGSWIGLVLFYAAGSESVYLEQRPSQH